MTRLVVLAVIVGCAHSGSVPAEPPVMPVAPNAPPAPPPPPASPAPAAAPSLDEAAVIARSHAFYDAIDRFDKAAVASTVAPSFILFARARYRDAAFLDKEAQMRLDHHAPVRTRTWSDEHVYLGAATAVFIGRSIQHIPNDNGQPTVDIDGYTSVVWAPVAGEWKIVFSEWARGGIEAEKEDWNEVFKMSNNFRKDANQLLIDTVKGKKPGTALDVEMGQGRNALYLAAQGWKVTGVDISDEGLKIAKQEAEKRKLKLDTILADLDKWDPGKTKWDLVTMIYAGDDQKLVQRLQPSIKKGGLFVLEYFAAQDDTNKFGAGGWPPGMLAKLFADGWEIVRDDVIEDIADWGLKKEKLVRFVARKK